MAWTRRDMWLSGIEIGQAARMFLVALVVAAGSWPARSHAQTFDSSSNGSDLALNLPANQGVIIFDPNDTARWGRMLDADGDGVYNFTTITIGTGTTLRLQGDKVNRPVYWLATGAVRIDGALDLSGSGGADLGCCAVFVDLNVRRRLAIPGSGGGAGGAGGRLNTSFLATPGEGPGAGAGGAVPCINVPTDFCGGSGVFGGNRYLLPLVGGSGGGGALLGAGYANGGAGGGAILIASSTSITITGSLNATGGSGGASSHCCGYSRAGGGGSGGAIRMVAATLAGSGQLDVRGGNGNLAVGNGSAGMVRLEAFSLTGTFTFGAGSEFVTLGSPVDPTSLRPIGSIRVIAVAGIAVDNATGSFSVPDVSLTNSGLVPVMIAATGIPPGTVVTLTVYPQTPTDLGVVNLPPVQVSLIGTLQQSTATVTFAFPYGFSRGTLRATWTP